MQNAKSVNLDLYNATNVVEDNSLVIYLFSYVADTKLFSNKTVVAEFESPYVETVALLNDMDLAFSYCDKVFVA